MKTNLTYDTSFFRKNYNITPYLTVDTVKNLQPQFD